MLGTNRIRVHRTSPRSIRISYGGIMVQPSTGNNYEAIGDSNFGHYLGGLGVVNDQTFIFGMLL